MKFIYVFIHTFFTSIHALLNMVIVLHVLKPLVRPHCSKPSIRIVSLLNQHISLLLHSMFPLSSAPAKKLKPITAAIARAHFTVQLTST